MRFAHKPPRRVRPNSRRHHRGRASLSEASVNEDLCDARRPERLDSGPHALQQPSPPERKAKPRLNLGEGREVIARRQSPCFGIERWNHAFFIVTMTFAIVNSYVDNCSEAATHFDNPTLR